MASAEQNTWMSGSSAVGRNYADLVAPGTDWFAAAGADGFKMYSSDLMYMPTNELQQVFTYLKANNIKLIVEAYMVTAGPGQSGEGLCNPGDMAAMVARTQALGGQIDVVQMDEALYRGVDVYGESLGQAAASVAANVATLKAAFPNVQIGDIEPFPSNSVSDVQSWIAALSAAGVHLTSFTPDIQWSTGSPSTSLPSLEALSSMLHANGIQLSIIYNGNQSDTSGAAWAATAEQRIAAICSDPRIQVDTAIIQTWQPFPQAATPTNVLGTVANVTAEYTAIAPLYEAGDISLSPVSSYAMSAPPQLYAPLDALASISGVACAMGIGDIANGSRIAIVLIDGAADLYATQHGAGTVGGTGTSELSLTGTESDINAELATLSTSNSSATSDTLDIETFDGSGRIDDVTVTLNFAQSPAPASLPPTIALGSPNSSGVYGDNVTTVATPSLTGTAAVGSTINLCVDGAAEGTAAVSGVGVWSYTLGSALADGAHAISVTDTNAAGNVSGMASMGLTIYSPNVIPAPAPPQVSPVSESGTTDTSAIGTSSPAPGLAVFDTTTDQTIPSDSQPYAGPVSGLQNEFISITKDSLNITLSTPNWFINGGGNDAIAASSGVNVLDGGSGSNFLTGGSSGLDTFFVDDLVATSDVWSTLSNFIAGDAATVWGVTAQDFAINWVNDQGAAGFTGLTLHATAPGKPTASLTMVGYSQADLSSGRLSVSFGASGGSNYMYIHGNR